MGIKTKLHKAINAGNLQAFRTELTGMSNANFYNHAAEKRGLPAARRILRQPKNDGGHTPFELAMSTHRFKSDQPKYLNMAREIADKDPAQLAMYDGDLPGTSQIRKTNQDYWHDVIKRIRAERNAPNNHEMKRRHEKELQNIAKTGVKKLYARRDARRREPVEEPQAQPQLQTHPQAAQLQHYVQAHAQSQAQLQQSQAQLQQSQAQLIGTRRYYQGQEQLYSQALQESQAKLRHTMRYMIRIKPIINQYLDEQRIIQARARNAQNVLPNIPNTRNRKKQKK